MTGPRLAIFTPDGQSKEQRAAHVVATLRALEPGALTVMLRDKRLDPTALLAHLRALEAICRAHDAPLFAPWDVRGALSKGSIGDHVGWHFPDRPRTLALVERVRAAAPERKLSVSTHSAAAAIAAAKVADIVYLGPIWATPEKTEAIGIGEITAAASQIEGARLFAIGGITGATRVSQALDAGADGVAGIRAFTAENIATLHAVATGMSG